MDVLDSVGSVLSVSEAAATVGEAAADDPPKFAGLFPGRFAGFPRGVDSDGDSSSSEAEEVEDRDAPGFGGPYADGPAKDGIVDSAEPSDVLASSSSESSATVLVELGNADERRIVPATTPFWLASKHPGEEQSDPLEDDATGDDVEAVVPEGGGLLDDDLRLLIEEHPTQ